MRRHLLCSVAGVLASSVVAPLNFHLTRPGLRALADAACFADDAADRANATSLQTPITTVVLSALVCSASVCGG